MHKNISAKSYTYYLCHKGNLGISDYIQQYPISLCSKRRLYCATGGGRRNRKRCGLQRVGHVTDPLHAGGQRQRLQLCRWLRF